MEKEIDMHKPIPESDWKKFKKVREVALQRLSQRILDEAQAVCRDESRTPHERYGDLYGLIQDRDRDIARAFDGFSRSLATTQLIIMANLDLLTEDEIAQFSPGIQKSITALT